MLLDYTPKKSFLLNLNCTCPFNRRVVFLPQSRGSSSKTSFTRLPSCTGPPCSRTSYTCAPSSRTSCTGQPTSRTSCIGAPSSKTSCTEPSWTWCISPVFSMLKNNFAHFYPVKTGLPFITFIIVFWCNK